MHGQKRADYKARQKNPAIANALQKKALQWSELTAKLAQIRSLTNPDETNLRTVLTVTEKLLSVNPDPMYLYNQRREVLLLLYNDNNSDAFEIETERVMTTACLKRNPKAYAAWFHRKWSLRYYLNLEKNNGWKDSNDILQEELELCSYFLKLDERNFHCWNYRRFVVSCMFALIMLRRSTRSGSELQRQQVQIQINGSWDLVCQQQEIITGPQIAASVDIDIDKSTSTLRVEDEGGHDRDEFYDDNTNIRKLVNSEWKFTSEKIASNFSNYSAFHYRSKLVPLIYSNIRKEKSLVDFAKEELEMIHQVSGACINFYFSNIIQVVYDLFSVLYTHLSFL